MEKVEGKSWEVGGERGRSSEEMLRRGALEGRKGGTRTPVLSWLPSPLYTVSARKLGAALWEFQHYVPLSQMNTGASNGATPGAGPSRPRRSRHLSHEEKGFHLSHFSTSGEQVAAYDPAFVPAIPSRSQGRIGLKTSAQLLKVLNRIWSLEEQQVSNSASIKALKAELDRTLVNTNRLIQERNAERGEIDDLLKQFSEENLAWKNKKWSRIEAAINSAKDELDYQRKLRKQSESLRRKLALNLSDVRSTLSNALKDLEAEKKWRILLEELCDEFARGVKDYEQEMLALRQKTEETYPGRTDHNRLILHVSESWLQNDARNGRTKRSSTAENLRPMRRRSSTESIRFNEVARGPRLAAGGKEDSAGRDELSKPSRDDNFTPSGNESMKLKGRKGKLRRNPSSLQVKFEEQMAWAMTKAGSEKALVVNREKSEHGEDGNQGQKMADSEVRCVGIILEDKAS